MSETALRNLLERAMGAGAGGFPHRYAPQKIRPKGANKPPPPSILIHEHAPICYSGFMVRDSQDFLDILDSFYDQVTESGAVLFPGCYDATTAAAKRIMAAADLHYVPGHKITELMADIVNIAAGVSSEGWLSDEQAAASFHELTAINSPLVRSFMADARMEKARYEPIMLTEPHASPLSERNAILRVRLKRMLAARQSYDPLPVSFLRAIRTGAERVLQAECFADYRPGALLQHFADMIQIADQIADQTFNELEGVSILRDMLREEGRLWKLYRGKAPRFRVAPDDPLRHNAFPLTRATMLYIPDQPGRPTIH